MDPRPFRAELFVGVVADRHHKLVVPTRWAGWIPAEATGMVLTLFQVAAAS